MISAIVLWEWVSLLPKNLFFGCGNKGISANVDTRVLIRDIIFAHCCNSRGYHGRKDSSFKNVVNIFHNKGQQSSWWNDIFSFTKLKEQVPPGTIILPGLFFDILQKGV